MKIGRILEWKFFRKDQKLNFVCLWRRHAQYSEERVSTGKTFGIEFQSGRWRWARDHKILHLPMYSPYIEWFPKISNVEMPNRMAVERKRFWRCRSLGEILINMSTSGWNGIVTNSCYRRCKHTNVQWMWNRNRI